jgi:hypothetical protein
MGYGDPFHFNAYPVQTFNFSAYLDPYCRYWYITSVFNITSHYEVKNSRNKGFLHSLNVKIKIKIIRIITDPESVADPDLGSGIGFF